LNTDRLSTTTCEMLIMATKANPATLGFKSMRRLPPQVIEVLSTTQPASAFYLVPLQRIIEFFVSLTHIVFDVCNKFSLHF
jgi:hypothetical protein